MAKTKDTETEDSESNKTRAHMVRVYEATASIKHPTPSDSRFRALMARAVNVQLTADRAMSADAKDWLVEREERIGKEERIRRNQLVRAYEAGCAVENPETDEAKIRAYQQAEFFRLYGLSLFKAQSENAPQKADKK